jgi:hypothetical protein
MAQSKKAELAALVGDCQQVYGVFIEMASRTRDALVESVSLVYLLIYRIRQDSALRTAYLEELREQKITVGSNEALQVIEYTFFRYIFHSDGNHKTEINKASAYAKACNAALADGVRPEDFVKYVKQRGGLSKFAMTQARGTRREAKRSETAQIDASELQVATTHAARPDLSFSTHIVCANTKVQERVAALTRELTAPTSLILEVRWDGTRMIVTHSRVWRPFRPSSVPPFQQAQRRPAKTDTPTNTGPSPKGKEPHVGTTKAKSGQPLNTVYRLGRARWQR